MTAYSVHMVSSEAYAMVDEMRERFRDFYFSLDELVHSQMAERLGGEVLAAQMRPNADVVDNLENLVKHTLQPLRELLGVPILVSSGYRCVALNDALGSHSGSDHVFGSAVDLVVPDTYLRDGSLDHLAVPLFDQPWLPEEVNANHVLFALAAKYLCPLGIDQLIHEYGEPGRPGWVHISGGKPFNRGKILSIKRDQIRFLEQSEAANWGLSQECA